jgi:hypothetical protein
MVLYVDSSSAPRAAAGLGVVSPSSSSRSLSSRTIDGRLANSAPARVLNFEDGEEISLSLSDEFGM